MYVLYGFERRSTDRGSSKNRLKKKKCRKFREFRSQPHNMIKTDRLKKKEEYYCVENDDRSFVYYVG